MADDEAAAVEVAVETVGVTCASARSQGDRWVARWAEAVESTDSPATTRACKERVCERERGRERESDRERKKEREKKSKTENNRDHRETNDTNGLTTMHAINACGPH